MQADRTETAENAGWPVVSTVGVDGFLVRFADRLHDAANRAALAFRAAAGAGAVPGVLESSVSLVSAYLRFDPLAVTHAEMEHRIARLVDSRDWFAAPLPDGRRLWRVPAAFHPSVAPQLEEAAAMAGLSPAAAVERIASTRLRVQTIGFAPGQPYLGTLPPEWDIPRQPALTDRIPAGAIAVAIRQMVLFSVSTPTGWRHVGQTALHLFRPDADRPFLLQPGDEVLFDPVSPDRLEALRARGPDGGATPEPLE